MKSNKQDEEDEFQKYLKQAPFFTNNLSEFNLLQWWKTHEASLPNMSLMAKDFLSVQSSSASSERMFSVCGNLLTKQRNRLSAKKLRISVCLKSWIECFSISK